VGTMGTFPGDKAAGGVNVIT